MKNIIIASILIILAGCGSHKPVDLSEKKTSTVNLETVKVEKGTLNSVIKLPGQLKPFLDVDIYPKVNGFVKEIHVDRGSVVHKDQVLMTLEAPELNQELEAAQEKLLEAKESLNASKDRFTRLNQAAKTPGAVSDMDIVNASSKYQADSASERSQEANVAAVRTMKDYLVVKAPFNGIIIERNVHPGALIGPNFKLDNKPLLKLEDNKKLRLEIFVPEEYAEELSHTNDTVIFTCEAYPGKAFNAAISRSSNSMYDQYRSEAIEADVTNKDSVFKPGMYVEASLKINSSSQACIVPTTSLVTSTEATYLVALENGKTKFIKVKTGIASGGKTEVSGDLKGDETILKNPSPDVKEGVALQ